MTLDIKYFHYIFAGLGEFVKGVAHGLTIMHYQQPDIK